MKPQILYYGDVKEWDAQHYVYVGRPSPFGNIFSHKEGTLAKYRVASSAEAVDFFTKWIESQPQFVDKIKKELVGKDLVCWCKIGKPCHARVLYFIANGFYPEDDILVSQPDLFD